MKTKWLPIIILYGFLASCAGTPETRTLYRSFDPIPRPVLDLPDVEPLKHTDVIPPIRFLNDPDTREFIASNETRRALLVITQDEHADIKKLLLDVQRYIKDVNAREAAHDNYYMTMDEWSQQLMEPELFIPCLADDAEVCE